MVISSERMRRDCSRDRKAQTRGEKQSHKGGMERCVVSRCRTGCSAGSGELCTAGGGFVTSWWLKEKSDGRIRWRVDVSQFNRSVNKQIASLLDSGRVEGSRVETGRGGQVGWMVRAQVLLLVLMLNSQVLRDGSCRPSGEQRAGGWAHWHAGQGSSSVGPGPPGSWQVQTGAAAKVPFLVRLSVNEQALSTPTKRQPCILEAF